MNNCIFCLQNPLDISVKFVGGTEESNQILSDFYLCTQIVLHIEINSPYSVCKSCLNDLHTANNFRIKCLTVQENLLKNTAKTEHTETNNKTCLKEEFRSNEVSSDTYENCVDSITNDDEGLENKSYQCDVCFKMLKSNKSLAQHKTLMHEKRKHIGKVTGFGIARRYHCKECPYSSPHSQTLVNHVRRHSGERPYICQCGKRFTQSSSLAAHQKTHSNTALFTCTVCGKQLKLAHSLTRHMRVHEDEYFSCSHCQKQLKSRESLKHHLQRHENIRNYSCEECGSTFVTSSELINHKKMHINEKLLQCNFCNYETNKKKTLILHLKRHTGIKTVKCNMCEAAFYTNCELRSHQRVHTRAKPYSCPLCAQHFTHSSSVNKHVRTVHGKQFKWSVRWQTVDIKNDQGLS